jgi:hypothetical protein
VRAVTLLLSISLAASYAAGRSAPAYPRFMKQENLETCGYCHVKDAGSGARNYRGIYYKFHQDSFAGFDDAAVAKAAGADIAPHADQIPASAPLAPPAAPHDNPLTAAWQAAHTAEIAYYKNTDDKDAKTAYIAALTAYTHSTSISGDLPAEKRTSSTIYLAKRVLALDPKNESAKADLKSAMDARTAVQK